MNITPLVENTSHQDLSSKHGLSFYIETKNHKILFDLGPDRTLFENARKRNIDLTLVDLVILSHGHSDHGGALGNFLKINSKARIYVQESAFHPHYSKVLFQKIPIGIDETLKDHPQVVLLQGDHPIDEELLLFTAARRDLCHSSMNDVLYEKDHMDDFSHEQNLLIFSGKETILIMGCGHCGVVNIMEKAKNYHPKVCIGGFHLYNPITKRTVSKKLLDELVKELKAYEEVQFYTCHCTGKKAYEYLSERLPNLSYLSCGQGLTL